jgi:hydroxymethylpyrimidine pyrophosphatase-like HAD family hydrolase
MRFVALATDYDGTLATHGHVPEEVVEALKRVIASGRKLIMVTGRELPDLMQVFPHLDLFERVVAENGGLLYCPATKQERPLTEPPPEVFVRLLTERGVAPISVGRTIVATWEPHEHPVLQAIHELGLEHHVIFNKGAVMVLPSGVNKCTGLKAALDEIGLSFHNVVGVGDAENDHAFLSGCECGVAVANALPMLKERADLVVSKDHGAGVVEVIDLLIESDLQQVEPRLTRHHLLIGHREDGQEVRIRPHGVAVLLAGSSASGKSTMAAALLERLGEQCRQYCLIDPEGDYQQFPGAVNLGTAENPPTVNEVLEVLQKPTDNAVVTLLGLKLEDRPAFLARLLPRLQELRTRTGRPHWLIVDEAHHLLPNSWDPAALMLPREFGGVLFITVHPQYLAPVVLSEVDVLVAMGKGTDQTVKSFCQALGKRAPRMEPTTLDRGEALVWFRREKAQLHRMRLPQPRLEQRRHVRKYAEGELDPDRSFYFRGPEGRLNLRAQNLLLFCQMADGLDDETWLFHLRRGDYSRWFREEIKDDGLADDAARVEQQAEDLSPEESRRRIREAVERRYTVPEGPPLPIPGKERQVEAERRAKRERERSPAHSG